MASTADLIAQKLGGKTLWEWRVENGLTAWDDYVEHIARVGYNTPASLSMGSFTTPDHADFAWTALDVRILIWVRNWSPEVFTCRMMGQDPADATDAWTFSLHPNGKLRTAIWDGTGSSFVGPEAEAFPWDLESRNPMWLRSTYTYSAPNGTWRYFYRSGEDDSGAWTELGSAQTQAGFAVRNSTAALGIRSNAIWDGALFAAEIRNGVDGTVVANPDFRTLTPGATSLVDGTGKTWTMTSNGVNSVKKIPLSTADDEYRFWSEYTP